MDKMVLALGNGVAIKNGEKLCVSIIDKSGNKRVGGEKVKKTKSFPFLRGIIFFIEGIVLYLKSLGLLGELEEKSENKSLKIAKNIHIASSYLLLTGGVLLAFLLGLVVLGFLPSLIFNKFFPYSYDYYFRALMIALFRTAFVYIIFVVLRFLPIMRGLYSFNGAGNIYLAGKGEKIRDGNYPLNFLNFLLNVFLFSTFMISLIAIKVHFLLNIIINLAIFVLCVSLVYEGLNLASKSNWGLIKDVCLITNWLVYARPNTTHKEVVIVAKREIENFEEFAVTDRARVPMSALYAEMNSKLIGADRCEESDIDWIIATVLNKSRTEVKLTHDVSQKEYRDIMKACARRAKGEPLSNIFGFVEFYGLNFEVNKKVLSPRMDTEVLVEKVIKKIAENDYKTVLDLCTGSGAIAVTIAKYTPCKVYASDISKQALDIAEMNAKKNGVKVEFCHSDLTKGLRKRLKYDIIVSNPPYIKSEDIEKLDVEVKKYDPRLALDGGEDGLDFYRRIIEEGKAKLSKKGWLFFEVGKGQADEVASLMQKSGYDNVTIEKDLNKIERVVYGRTCK